MTQPKLEVILSPAEFAVLGQRDLSQAVCVVFDILRATTTMITALANGAEAIIPVAEISEALAMRQKNPGVVLAGERHGLRIRADLTGSIDFDLGNSPREFSAERVSGKTIVMTTTNGTRALRACAGARMILVSSFLNLRATTNWLREKNPSHLILVCSGSDVRKDLVELCRGPSIRFCRTRPPDLSPSSVQSGGSNETLAQRTSVAWKS